MGGNPLDRAINATLSGAKAPRFAIRRSPVRARLAPSENAPLTRVFRGHDTSIRRQRQAARWFAIGFEKCVANDVGVLVKSA